MHPTKFPDEPISAQTVSEPAGDSPAPVSASPQEEAGGESFADILSQFEQQQAEEGQQLQGTVVSVTAESVFVDIGRKMDGVLPVEALKGVEVKPGDVLPVILAGRDAEGNYRLSVLKVERPKDWSGLQAAFEEKRVIAGTVEEVVKGGLRVDIGARAFMPASRSGARDLAEMEKLVGQEIQCRITKLDTEKEDIVVDRRVVLEEQRAKAREESFAALHEGDVVSGTVRSVTDFGAFVDLGGIDGLLHVNDMSWARGIKPSDVVRSGDSIQVKILKINRETRKVSLGMKQLQPDPWTLAAEKYKQGDRVKGKVARLADFGAFVELEPGVDGLIHLSELSWSRKVRKPADLLKVGDLVEVMVLGVNTADKRISLGLKQTLGDPWVEAKAKYPINSIHEITVSQLLKFSAICDLGDDIEGMIHIADISREKRLNHPSEALAVGQTVRAQVIELDNQRRQVRFSMKQLEPTAADHWIAEHQVGETITGRVVDVSSTQAKVEIGEGVHGFCKLLQSEEKQSGSGGSKPADLAAMTALLTQKWKGGGSGPSSGDSNALRGGQIRQFKIVAMDPQNKRVTLELAG
jgi:small subunit ribosomal protein S1